MQKFKENNVTINELRRKKAHKLNAEDETLIVVNLFEEGSNREKKKDADEISFYNFKN